MLTETTRSDTVLRRLLALHPKKIDLVLDRVRRLLATLGHPEEQLPPVIHVAGTNGKGSACAFSRAMLEAAGLKVAMYTSPHLVRFHERIRLPGGIIGEGGLAALLAECEAANGGAPITFFEITTAAAFLAFSRAGADALVLEVGLGGLYDATNVIARPKVCLVMPVGLDHAEFLGTSIAGIAREKAGIVKPGVPVVCGAEAAAAVRVIRKRAAEVGAPLTMVFGAGRRLAAVKAGGGGRRPTFRYETEDGVLGLSPGLRGAHQGRNAAIAAAAARVLARVWRPIPDAAIVRGVARARWEGRLEPVGRRPLVLLDGAHNEAGAAALRAYLDGLRPRPLVLVFTMMKDKAIGRVAGILFPAADKVVVTTIPFARDASPGDILRRARACREKVTVEPSLRKAVALARAEAGPGGAVVITGSLFLVGEAKRLRIPQKRMRS